MKIEKNELDSADMLSKLEEKKQEYEIRQQKQELRQQELIKRTQNAKKVLGISIVYNNRVTIFLPIICFCGRADYYCVYSFICKGMDS